MDVWGQIYLDYWNGRAKPIAIERDDGYIDTLESAESYFAEPGWQPEVTLLKRMDESVRHKGRTIVPAEDSPLAGMVIAITGGRSRVLDLACGVGRYTLFLERMGCRVRAIDNSVGAIQVCRERGCCDARLGDLRDLSLPDAEFDAIIVMGNTIGAYQTPETMPNFLATLRRATRDGGRLVVGRIDPSATDKPEHLTYHQRNRERGIPPGLVNIRLRYGKRVDDWMTLWLLTIEEMDAVVAGTGWELEEREREEGQVVELFRAV